jgi:surface polysaccharide O-acyltransferase-like enzyme
MTSEHSPSINRPSSFVWVEVLRGLAVLSAVAVHVSGRYLRDIPQDRLEWWWLAMLNRAGTR